MTGEAAQLAAVDYLVLDDGPPHLVGVPPDAASVDPDVPVELVTRSVGTDDDGTEAIAFGFAYGSTTGRRVDER